MHTHVSNVKIGRMVAKDLGIKSVDRENAREIFEWFHGLNANQIIGIREIVPKRNVDDAMNHVVVRFS